MDAAQTDSFDQLMSLEASAALLSLSRMSLWRLQKSGELPPPLMLSPRCVRYPRRVLLQFIKQREERAAADRLARQAHRRVGRVPLTKASKRLLQRS